MKKSLINLLIVCILHSILLYSNSLGINVILFTMPLLLYLVLVLKKHNLINNKKGLLYIIPIIILSLTYTIYSNVFNALNIIAIPVLYILMFIYTIKPTNNLLTLIMQMFRVAFKPLDKVSTFVKEVKCDINSHLKIKDDNKKKIKSFIIVIPIVILVLVLLSSADMIFGNLFTAIFDYIDSPSIFKLIFRIIAIILLFIYIGATTIYLKDSFIDEEVDNRYIRAEEFTVKLLLTTLNIIYIVFDIIQIHSLMLHHVGDNINYAEYARSGFFQLMFISLLNIIIILISKNSNKNKYNQAMGIIMIGLTFIIIISSFLRMHLYEVAYGYTVLRLGVYIILATEVILLIPTVIYILKDKYPILRYYLVICVSVYTFVNLFSMDDIITNNNIERYYKTGKLDIEYLENYNYDNIPELIDLYNNVSNNKDIALRNEILDDLDYYLKSRKTDLEEEIDNIFEYNISKQKALNELDNIK